MSREKLKELLKKRSTKIGSVVLAAALVFGGGMWAGREPQVIVPEFVSFVDPVDTVMIEDEETPLASVKTTVKKKTKKIRLKKKSKKSYTKKGKTKKTTKSVTKGNTTTTTVTVVQINYVFKKGSKIKKQVTTTTTTVTVTTKASAAKSSNTTAATTKVVAGATNTKSPFITEREKTFNWSKVDSRVKKAFDTIGVNLITNPGANADGHFVAQDRTITVQEQNGTVYHELGHFLAFVVGNYDRSSAFQAVYAKEQGSYQEYNRSYVCGNASEYFAESFCQYVLDPAGLRSSRPDTYAAITEALSKLTDAQINIVKSMYR